ncbi:MAG: histidine kinase, partial [Saprospiraceae bacterium]|nr:histidine kinase [Saprospiraceae bacterium]
PHFLFNSLNILKTMVKNNDPMSEEYVIRLSELYRNLLLSNQ